MPKKGGIRFKVLAAFICSLLLGLGCVAPSTVTVTGIVSRTATVTSVATATSLLPTTATATLPLTVYQTVTTTVPLTVTQARTVTIPQATTITAPPPETTPSADPYLRISGSGFTLRGKPFVIKGFNYFPRYYGWSAMEDYNWDEVDAELNLAAEMNANTVRVIVDYGYSTRSTQEPESALASYHPSAESMLALSRLLSIAAKYNMGAIVQLFDFMPGWLFVEQGRHDIAEKYLEEFVPAFKDDPRIFAWNVFNEGDLGVPKGWWTLEQALKFYEAMYKKIKELDPNHPVTAGIGRITSAPLTRDFVDYLTFHYYEEPMQFDTAYAAFKTAVGREMPVVVEETGLPSQGTPEQPQFNAANQARFIATCLDEILGDNKLAGVLVWQLNDIGKPATARSHLPDMNMPEYEMHFGVLNLDLSPKPAAAAIRQYYSGDSPPRLLLQYSRLSPAAPPPAGYDRPLAVAFWSMEFLDSSGNALKSLTFGTLEVNLIQGGGWYANETDGSEPFQWTGDLDGDSVLCLTIPAGTAAIRFRARAIYDGIELKFIYAGRTIAEKTLSSRVSTYTVAVSLSP
jgi:hypothetical protein